MDEFGDVPGRDAGGGQGVKSGIIGPRRRAWHLGDGHTRGAYGHQVGEGSADLNADREHATAP